MRNPRNRRNVRPESVDKRDMCERHYQRPLIDGGCVAFRGHHIVDAIQKLDLGTARLLRQPDLPHGGKLVFTHHNFITLAELHSIRDRIDSR